MESKLTTVGSRVGGYAVEEIVLGNRRPLVLIAGPCQIESTEHSLMVAGFLKAMCEPLGIPLIFKSSFDKANRTSDGSPRGVGLAAGLEALAKVRLKCGIPVTTDVHTEDEAYVASGTVDLLQIPAMLSRQTDLIHAAARHGMAVNIKKGQGMAPVDMMFAAEKARIAGCSDILLTERGTTFGYGNLVNDFRGVENMKEGIGYPVVFDATHSVQQPGRYEGTTGGQRQYVPALARAAVAVGVAAVFIECHEDPDRAPSDGPCMMRLDDMPALLSELAALDEVRKQFGP
jgi:2-dehydro-3-deoxyphosphooctonate aldolase (KDO 8-P synthase)